MVNVMNPSLINLIVASQADRDRRVR